MVILGPSVISYKGSQKTIRIQLPHRELDVLSKERGEVRTFQLRPIFVGPSAEPQPQKPPHERARARREEDSRKRVK